MLRSGNPGRCLNSRPPRYNMVYSFFSETHRKFGKGIASWVWVIGGVIFGMVIFLSGYSLLGGMMGNASDDLMRTEISEFTAALEGVCVSESKGAIKVKELSLSEDIKAVYIAASEISPAPDKVSTLISDGESAVGGYLCYQLTDSESNLPRECWEIPCEVNMTYMGTPTLKPTLASRLASLLGERTTYHYRVKITKTGEKAVLVEAETILQSD